MSVMNRSKVKFVSLGKIFQKSENVTLSDFYNCMMGPNDREQFLSVFSNLLGPAN